MSKKNVFEIVTERFIEQMKKGIIPWERPWLTPRGIDRTGAWSRSTGKPYSLLNQMLLPEPGEYATFKQIEKAGGKVRKGAEAWPIFFWDIKNYEVKDEDDEALTTRKSVVFRYYTVFRLADTDLDPKFEPAESVVAGLKEPQRCKKADSIMADYTTREGIEVKHRAANSALYQVDSDRVLLPFKKQFKTKSGYYGTAFHELVHSTGAEKRLHRFCSAGGFSIQERAKEELIAEIGSNAICQTLGLNTKDAARNTTAYLQSWMTVFKNDPKFIVSAAGRAEKAVDFIVAPQTAA